MNHAAASGLACLLLLSLAPAQQAEIEVAWKTPLASPSFGSAAVADIDGDGRLEVAFGTYFGDDSVRVLNGEDGSEYRRFDAGNACVDASLRFVDLDRDGALELVVPISNRGWVLAFDAKTGDEKWRYATNPIQCTDTPPAIVDFDGDKALEVVYGTFHGKLHVISGATGRRERVFHPTKHFVQSGPIVRDLDGDGVRDLVCTTFKGDNRVYAVNGKTGATLWKFQVPGKHMGMYHGPSIGDIDGDDSLDLVVGAYDGAVYRLDAKDGTQRWRTKTKDRYIMSPTVIADLDRDGKSEVVVASQNMTVIDAGGRVLWSKPCARGGYDSATRGASVADLDGDGKLDVASLSGSGMLRVFDGMSGRLLVEFDAATLCDDPVMSSSHGVTIADLTGDGKLDVFFVVGATRPKKHGLAICLTGFAGSGRGWYMLRHDPQNTGNLATRLDPSLLRFVENLTPAKHPVRKPKRPPKRPKAESPRSRTPAVKAPDMAHVYELAKQRGIPRDAVTAAKTRSTDFAKHGADGFRAVCLLIETGSHDGIRCHPLLKMTYAPGLEKELLKLCARESLPNFGLWSALHCLGYADTKAVHTYLLDRLKTERDPGLFMSIAQALGELGEERGIRPVAAQILRFERRWSGVEPHMLQAIQKMGAASALPWFIEYVTHEKASNFYVAFNCIAKADRAKASKLAVKVLDSRRELTARQRSVLKRYAK